MLAFSQYDLRLGYRQLISFSPHIFYQYGEVQLSSARDFETICGIGLFDHESHVYFQLFVQSLSDMAAGYVFSGFSGKRGLVYHKVHAEGRLFYVNHLHRLRVFWVAYGLAYGNIRDSGNYHDVSALGFRYRHSFKPSVYEDLIYLSLYHGTVGLGDSYLLSFFYNAFSYSADAQSAYIIVIGQGGNL